MKKYCQAEGESKPVEPKQYNAAGEKLLSDPGKEDSKHSNPDINKKQEAPKLSQSGKME